MPDQTTRISVGNRTGVIREDLYQLTAYLAGFADPPSRIDGFQIYPADGDGQVARFLSPNNPWKVASGPEQNLWFLAMTCESEAGVATLSEAEQSTIQLIRSAIGKPSSEGEGRRLSATGLPVRHLRVKWRRGATKLTPRW